MKSINNIQFFFLSVIIFMISAGCSIQTTDSTSDSKSVTSDLTNQTNTSINKPILSFTENEYDFGEIVEGETITHAFRFRNIGGTDLIISNVKTSCGCTVSDFSKEPIKPGDSGIIKLTFDSNGQIGYQNKTATIESNSIPNQSILRLKAKVKNS